jgi:hypothetical protein
VSCGQHPEVATQLLQKGSKLSVLVSFVELDNSWIVFDSLGRGEQEAKIELRELQKKYDAKDCRVVLIVFENQGSQELCDQISSLYLQLKPYLLQKSHYVLSKTAIKKILNGFLKNSFACGLIKLLDAEDLIPKKMFKDCISEIQKNRQEWSKTAIQLYQNNALKAQALFAREEVFGNIKSITNRIYLDDQHTFVRSLFDREGRSLREKFSRRLEWYDITNHGSDFMLAIAAFGFEDSRGPLLAAFHRILDKYHHLEESKNWTAGDKLLREVVQKRQGLLEYYSWGVQEQIFKRSVLSQFIPLAEIIPEGLFLFRSADRGFTDLRWDLIDYLNYQFEIDTIYPNLTYTTIEI